MQTEIKIVNENLLKLARDVALIKNILMSEGELSDWAKKQLSIARSKHEKYFSLEEVKRQILTG